MVAAPARQGAHLAIHPRVRYPLRRNHFGVETPFEQRVEQGAADPMKTGGLGSQKSAVDDHPGASP
jgi:hypothetical protein